LGPLSSCARLAPEVLSFHLSQLSFSKREFLAAAGFCSYNGTYCILFALWYRLGIDLTSVENKRRRLVKKLAIGTMTFVFLGATLLAHPHFRKTVTAKLGTVDVSVAYQTVPSNEMHAQNAKVGAFTTPRAPTLTLSAELKAGTIALPAGEYTIGVIKNSDKDWTMALYPGKLARGTEPDASKIIKLDSQFTTAHGTAEHMTIDITPGHGKQEGKAVLLLQFGTLYLTGSLS
jgi:Protein of unknown function (DUF2911)